MLRRYCASHLFMLCRTYTTITCRQSSWWVYYGFVDEKILRVRSDCDYNVNDLTGTLAARENKPEAHTGYRIVMKCYKYCIV